MPPRPTPFSPDRYYHIYNRALSGALLFESADDYKRLLRMLKPLLELHRATVIAYCLLPTHFHLVLRQDGEVPLSRLVQTLLNGYVQATNKRRQRRGPLCEGRFHAKAIKSYARWHSASFGAILRPHSPSPFGVLPA